MKELEKYLNKDEKELLSLIHGFLEQFENARIRQGGLNPDDIEKIKYLNTFKLYLITIAEEQIEREKNKLKPLLTQCTECEIEKERKPIREEINDIGFMCNLFYCDECKTEYLDGHPNNAKDQMSSIENLLAILEENKESLKNMPTEFYQDVENMKKQHLIFKKACELEEETYKTYQQTLKNRDEQIANIRDYLFLANLNKQRGNLPMGEC